jgi:serine/threonine-protein kinase
VTPELEMVVMRAMEKQPARRFPDADAFIAALEHARAALPRHAMAPAMVEEATLYDGGHGAPPLEELYEEEVAGRRWGLWLLGLLLVAAVAAGGYYLLARDRGPEQVAVPDVAGVDEASATTRLRADGFQTRTVRRSSTARPKDTVISTNPPGGEDADRGSLVTLTVSAGPPTAQVPSVDGLTRRQARARLRARGFKIEERREASDSVPDGKAIRTSPPARTTLEKGESVILLLSTGVEQVEVPDVTGQGFSNASSQLANRGFKIARNEQATDEEDPGTVLSQNPKSGAKIDKGSTVTLTVAKQPEEVEVPDVTGESQRVAVQRLSKDGFEIEIVEQPVGTHDEENRVIEQDPAGGRVKRGSTVTITIARFDQSLAPGQSTPATPSTPSTPATPPPATPTTP